MIDVRGGDPPLSRVTLTLPVLDAAAQAIFVVAGAQKANVLRAIVSAEDASLPGARVTLPRGTVTLLADAEAAIAVARRDEGRPP